MSMGKKIKKIFLLCITIMTTARHNLNLLYVTADETSHYVLVKVLNRQYNNYKAKKYFCQYYLHSCTSEEVSKNHLGRCKLHGEQRIKLPEADDKKGRDKAKFTKTNTNYIYLSSSMQILKGFYVNKTRVNHH